VRSVAKIIKKLGKSNLQGMDQYGDLPTGKALSLSDVLEIVASYYKLPQSELAGESRRTGVILPRQVAMYLMRSELNSAFEQIGVEFGGKNHTTVMHSCEKVERQLKKDKNLLRDINAIKKDMGL
jgi:chromosomal replication initiator protein